MKNSIVIATIILTLAGASASAQHEHHQMPKKGKPQTSDTRKAGVPAARPSKTSQQKVVSPDRNGQQSGQKGGATIPAARSPKTQQEKVVTPEHHDHHHQLSGTDTSMEMDEMDMEEPVAITGQEHDMSTMSHILSLNLPMNRNGSGTSWNPDESPMYMYMNKAGKWTYMLHGNFFIRYNRQDITGKGSRGAEQWDAPNMVMAMAQRKVGNRGLFHLSAMLSADAVFTGQRGYPLLFQSGESAHGEPLVDRQHPHDLFAELSASYAYAINKKSDVYVYLGYPGEPALGATTFMHRASGMDNPDAPISHHWVDATHISFGVATLGYRLGKFKAEGSLFTGREPNENRYDFDKPRFDSRSARLSFNPTRNWSMQLSHGFIKSPEELHANEDIYRTTASASFSKVLGNERFLNATGLWGMNKLQGHDAEHAALVEASLRANRLVLYGRYEWVQKSREELNLDETAYGHDAIFPVNAFTLGGAYDVLRKGAIRTSLGTQFSVYSADSRLDALYGDNPIAWEAYLRFYPSLMKHKM